MGDGRLKFESRSKCPLYRVLALTLSLAILQAGCSTMHLPNYEPQGYGHYKNSQVQDGLAVAIHPLTDKEESEKYFGTDLLSGNVLAVFVMAENQSPGANFLISNRQFSLRAEKQDYKGAATYEGSSETAGQATMLVGALLLYPVAVAVLPMLFAGAKMISDSTEIKRNFAVKELKTRTISPGEGTHGFVYFQLPANGAVPHRLSVHVEVQELKRKGPVVFDLPFEWKRN